MDRLRPALLVLLILTSSCTSAESSMPTAIPTATAGTVPSMTWTATKANTPTPEPPPTLTATPQTPTPTPFPLAVTQDITYTAPLQPDLSAQALDVYAPAAQGAWPVVVVLHGYLVRKEDVRLMSKAIAGQGAVVFTANWPAWTSPSIAVQGDGAKLREWVETVACAIRFARATASDYGGDPGRVTLVGHSLGGGIGSVVALAGDNIGPSWEEFASTRGGPPPQIDCLASEGSAYPDAFVGYGGAYMMFESLEQDDPELWKIVSPYALIGSNPNLQVRLIHGKWDSMMPEEAIELSIQLVEAMQEAGYDATWTVVDAGHQFSPTGPTGQETVQMIVETARE
jgi:acetyl esterase/lipase